MSRTETDRRPSLDPAAVRFGGDGLIPGVVQDIRDGRVLMLGYLDAVALEATLTTGLVHFHSRSRGRLWKKGETSGNVLELRGTALDCDGDTLLLTVEPTGPTCHRGSRSCFDPEPGSTVGAPERVATGEPDMAIAPAGPRGLAPGSDPADGSAFGWLETLWATIVDRARTRPTGSYTARLLDGGTDAVGRKVTEEATELLIAAKDDATAEAAGADRAATRAALAGEAADLLYHVLVLLAERGLPPTAVIDVLRDRHTA